MHSSQKLELVGSSARGLKSRRATPSGSQRSTRFVFTPVNPSGATPMIVCGTPDTSIVFPRIAASPPYCVCHSSWLTTATCSFSSRSSAGAKKRPIAGRTPSIVM